jgi:hypothetical protein
MMAVCLLPGGWIRVMFRREIIYKARRGLICMFQETGDLTACGTPA